VRWWRRLVNRGRLERELDRELRFHYDRQVEDNIRAGMSEEEARRHARVQFGGIDQVAEECRDVRGARWLDEVADDLRFALRLLAKERGATAVAVIALALGIGVSNTFFTVVNAVCLRGLPIDDVEQVMYVGVRDARDNDHGLSYADFEDMRAASTAFAGFAAFSVGPAVIGDDRRAPDRVTGAYISENTFQLLRERPILGRDLLPSDDRPGAPPVVLLGASVWKTRYQGDPEIVSRTIRINGLPATVVGVMRDGFRFPNNTDIWQPLGLMPGVASQSRDTRSLGAFGRLENDATAAQATSELSAVTSKLSREFPATNRGIRPMVVPINEHYNGSITDPVWLAFMSAGILVLLVACANVANLLLMRAVYRAREIAVRVSLGATRLRVVRQLLVESMLLALAGGVFGLGLSVVGARLLSVALTENAPYWLHFSMDGMGVAVLTGICVFSVIVFGLAPAMHLSKTDVNDLLQEGGRAGGGGVRARRWTAVFLTAEFALTIVLLAAVMLGVRSFQTAQANDAVIDPSNLLTMWVSLPAERYAEPDRQMAFYDRLRDRLRGVEFVTSSGVASALPFGGGYRATLTIDGRAPDPDALPTITTVTVGGQYFRTIGVSMLRGRPFGEADGHPGQEHAIVNARFAAQFFPREDPIGRRIRLTNPREPGTPAPWLTIVGVSPSIRQYTPGIEPEPVVYVPLRLGPLTTAAVMLRHTSEAGAVAAVVRHEVRALDPELPVYRIMSMERVISESQLNGRVSQVLITVIACIALALSVVGVYAVTAHGVAQRTRELGIRMALGAKPPQLITMVLKRSMKQLVYGVIAGIGCAVAWERLLGDPAQPHRITDPLVLALTCGVVVLSALLASLWPARRASWLDPVAALRHE
jgi:putative ABC transport system permease protein